MDQRGDPAASIVQAGEVRSVRIEALRALAALGVVVAHTFAYSQGHHIALPSDGVHQRVVHGSGAGVYLFFAISGYLLFWPFVRAEWGDGGRLILRRYAINRVLRIMPLYYVMVVVVLVLQGGGMAGDWLHFLTWTENYSAGALARVNSAAWTVIVELYFYALLPLIAFGLARASRRRASVAMAMLAGLGAASVAVAYLASYRHPASANLILASSLPANFFYFATGMLLAFVKLIWERRAPRALAGPLGSANVWVLGSALVWAYVLLANGQLAPGLVLPVASVASALLVGACVLPLRDGVLLRPFELRALAALGVISYSVYLWHVPLLTRLVAHLPGLVPHFFGLLAVVLPILLIGSYLSYRFIESPFLRLRRFWGQGSAPKGAKEAATPPPQPYRAEPWRSP